jgi:hypothetical protein
MGAAFQAARWCLRWWIVIPLALLIVWLVATAQTQHAIDAELAAIKAKGEPIALVELAPQIPPGEPNAALIYENAFSFLPAAGDYDYDHALADPDFARQYLVAREIALRQLQQAAQMRYCAFPNDWTRPMYELTFPNFARVREAGRLLVLDSSVLAADGKADESLDALTSTYVASSHAMTDPILISALVGYAIIGIAHGGLEESLSLADPSRAACRSMYDALGRIDLDTPFRRATLGERAGAIQFFDDVRTGRLSLAEVLTGFDGNPSAQARIMAALYPTLGRPLFNIDEASMLEFHRRHLEAAALPWPQSSHAFDQIQGDIEELPGYSALLTQMVFPVYGRADWSKRKAAATLAVDRAALAIEAFKAQTRRYPDTLKQVEALGWDLPDDPLSGKPLLYRRKGDGFTVWSVGPNMKDDGGVEYDPSQNMDYTSGPYDITFICDRQRIEDKRAERKRQWEQTQAEVAQQQAEESARRSSPSHRGFRDGRSRGR